MKKKATVILFLLVTLSRAADLGTTHYFLQGNMSREANPFVTVFGMNWDQLVISNILITTVVLALTLFYCYGRTKVISKPIKTISEFGGICLYNQSLSPKVLIRRLISGWPLPKDWYQYFRYMAYVIPYGVISGGFAAVFSWWAVNSWAWEWVRIMRRTMAINSYSLFEASIGFIFAIIGSYIFFRTEMKIANQEYDEKQCNTNLV